MTHLKCSIFFLIKKHTHNICFNVAHLVCGSVLPRLCDSSLCALWRKSCATLHASSSSWCSLVFLLTIHDTSQRSNGPNTMNTTNVETSRTSSNHHTTPKKNLVRPSFIWSFIDSLLINWFNRSFNINKPSNLWILLSSLLVFHQRLWSSRGEHCQVSLLGGGRHCTCHLSPLLAQIEGIVCEVSSGQITKHISTCTIVFY